MFERLARWWRIRSLDRGEYASEGERPVDNIDAGAAAAGNKAAEAGLTGPAGYPPNYVKSYDEGRPPR